MRRLLLAATAALLFTANFGIAADLTAGMKKGTPDVKSAGPITFAPQGILLLGDPKGAAIFAIATADTSSGSPAKPLDVENIDGKIAALLGTDSKGILINDLAVNPETGSTFLSVSRGTGPDAAPVVVRLDSAGKLAEFPLKDVNFSKATIPNAPTDDRGRQEVTTDLQFTGGQVIVAGLSNEEFASKLRVLPFPFAADAESGSSIEIFHGAHGKLETRSPVRTLAVFEVGGQPNVLAAYTCTPLVRFPLSDLKPGGKIRGTTVAELGNRNRPLDMIVYQKDGKDYLLMANSSRGVMKVDVGPIDKTEGIVDPVKGGGTAGLAYDTIKDLQGVTQLDKLDKDHALILVQTDAGIHLKTVALP
jgi:hypothetical protein